MDDSQCLLLDFHNESNLIAVGFRDWLYSPLSDNEIKVAIEEKHIIEIKWPDCNVLPASKMLRKLEFCEWKKCVARILANGTWVEMSEKAKTLLNLNVLQSTKSTRKLLTRKELNDNFHHSKHKKKEKVKSKKKNVSKNSTKENTDALGKNNSNKKNKFLTDLKLAESRKHCISDDESSDSSSNSEELRNSRKKGKKSNEFILMQQKIKDLEEENLRIKNKLKQNKLAKNSGVDSSVASSSSSNTGVNSAKRPNSDCNSTCTNSGDKANPDILKSNNKDEISTELSDHSFDNANRNGIETEHSTFDDTSPSEHQQIQPNFTTELNELNQQNTVILGNDFDLNSILDKMDKDHAVIGEIPVVNQQNFENPDPPVVNQQNFQNSDPLVVNQQNFENPDPPVVNQQNIQNPDLPVANQQIFQNLDLHLVNQENVQNPDRPLRVLAQNTKNQKKISKGKDKTIVIGGVECDYHKVAVCNRSSISKFTTELAVLIFDKEELEQSSLTGKLSNFQKNTNTVAKKQLCPIKVQGMKDYVLSIFGDTNDNRILFKNGLRTKLNNSCVQNRKKSKH